LRPALRVHRYGGAQIDQRLLESLRPHVLPPVEIARVPAFKRPQDAAILSEPDIVRNLGRIIDIEEIHPILQFLFFLLASVFVSNSGLRVWWAKARKAGAPTSAAAGSFTHPTFCLVYRHVRLVSNSALRPVP